MRATDFDLVQRKTSTVCEINSDTRFVISNDACCVGFGHNFRNLWNTPKRSINDANKFCISVLKGAFTFMFKFS